MGRCEACKEGYVSRWGSLECLRCPSGSVNNTCKCSKGHVWKWDYEYPEKGKCLPIISIKTLKILVGVLTVITVMACLIVLLLVLKEKRRRACETTIAPVIFNRTVTDTYESRELTEKRSLEETVRQIQATEGEEGRFVAPQITAEAEDLGYENHIYEIVE